MPDANEKWAASLRTGRQNAAEMPEGGATNAVLAKRSAANYDVAFVPIAMLLGYTPLNAAPSAYVDPASGTFNTDLVAALVAAGLMQPAP